ncbi:MAG: hypothetical protein LAP87_03530 [Acidobacteriia bacterium]|nr:hypothetical protein [Terriglobia bacterium]
MSSNCVVRVPGFQGPAGEFGCDSCGGDFAYFPEAREIRPGNHTSEMLEAQIKRIAGALHDDAGQLLALIQIRLAEALSQMPGHCASSFAEVHALLGQLETQLRDFSHELRPTILDDCGLAPALEILLEGFSRRTGIRAALTTALESRVDPAAEVALYRAVQEALINAGRYSGATLVRICVRTVGRQVRCVIQDNGVGFDMSARGQGGLGLLGMRERVEGLGGHLAIQSQPGRGTELVIRLPLAAASERVA